MREPEQLRGHACLAMLSYGTEHVRSNHVCASSQAFMGSFLGVVEVRNWGVTTNWWGPGSPFRCGVPLWSSFLAALLSGFILGVSACILACIYLFGFPVGLSPCGQ